MITSYVIVSMIVLGAIATLVYTLIKKKEEPQINRHPAIKPLSASSTRLTKPILLGNTEILSYKFLDCLYSDVFFPDFLVDKCKHILLQLCESIENTGPVNLEELYALTQDATEKINQLQEEIENNGAEIETSVRECIAENFEFIAEAYGFDDADLEEMIENRDW